MSGTKSEIAEYIEALVIAVVLAFFIITFIAQSFLVNGSSMVPTLHDGERLLVDKLSYRFREPQRGEIIVFKYPANPRRKFIKRVIGLPGDRVEIRDRTVFLNGRALEEPYINEAPIGRWGPINVRQGHLFVLGDNRNNSDDSRFPDVGQVPEELIVGRALIKYWPFSQAGIVRRPALFRGMDVGR